MVFDLVVVAVFATCLVVGVGKAPIKKATAKTGHAVVHVVTLGRR